MTTINDKEWAFLAEQTGKPGPFNDMYFKYLRGLGYTGTLQDMIAKSGWGLTPSKGGGGYLTAVRAAALAATGRPSDMDVGRQPTITSGTSADAALTQQYTFCTSGVLANQDKIRTIGGERVAAFSSAMGIKSATTLANGNMGATRYQNQVAIDIETDADTVEFRIFSLNANKTRFLVSEGGGPFKYAVPSAGLTTISSPATATSFQTLAFADEVSRIIRIELATTTGDAGGAAAFVTRIAVPPGKVINAPVSLEPPVDAIIYADSYGQGASATFKMDGVFPRLCDILGWSHAAAPSIGGTGFVKDTTTGAASTAIARLDDMLLVGGTKPKIGVVAFGTNDLGLSGVQAAAEVTLAGVRSRLPTAPIWVITPWDLEAPSAMSAQRQAVRDAVSAAVVAMGGTAAGFYVSDPTGVSFTKADAFHPDDAGVQTLVDWLDTEFRTNILGL